MLIIDPTCDFFSHLRKLYCRQSPQKMAQPAVAANGCDLLPKVNWTSATDAQSSVRTDRRRCPPCYGCHVSALVSSPESVNVYVRRNWWCTRDKGGGLTKSTGALLPSRYRCCCDYKKPQVYWYNEYSIIVAESRYFSSSCRSTALLRGAHLCFRFGVMLLHYSLPLFSISPSVLFCLAYFRVRREYL
ncbi:hypothetical protein HDV64DRAFT_256180 [Trichoderma sp. TUCIM 5745]